MTTSASGSAPALDGEEASGWVQDYILGATLDEIAAKTGVTKPTVVNRLTKLGIPIRNQAETNALRRKKAFDLHGQTIRNRFLQTRDVKLVSGEVGLPEATIKLFLRNSVPDYEVLARAPRNPSKVYTENDLITSLRQAAATVEGILTNAAYEGFVDENPDLEDGRRRPGNQVMGLRFGSWTGALTAAGLPANPHAGPAKQFEGEATAIRSIVACWHDLVRPPNVAAYDEWQKGKIEHPSSSTARRLLGSWNLGLVRAWQIVHGIVLDQDDADVAIPPSLAEGQSDGSGALPDHGDYRPADEEASVAPSVELSLPNYLELERAVGSHARIQNAVAAELSGVGLTPWSPTAAGPQFDLAFRGDDGAFTVVEVKSCTEQNLELQLRLGLGQVLRYAHQLRLRHDQVRAVLATELNPPSEWLDLLEQLAVHVIREASLKEDLQRVLAVT